MGRHVEELGDFSIIETHQCDEKKIHPGCLLKQENEYH